MKIGQNKIANKEKCERMWKNLIKNMEITKNIYAGNYMTLG